MARVYPHLRSFVGFDIRRSPLVLIVSSVLLLPLGCESFQATMKRNIQRGQTIEERRQTTSGQRKQILGSAPAHIRMAETSCKCIELLNAGSFGLEISRGKWEGVSANSAACYGTISQRGSRHLYPTKSQNSFQNIPKRSTAGALYKKILSGTRVVWCSYFDSGRFCGKI